ncbi:MAG: hypothetical protein M3N26_04465 [Pseudomonadota bacterium]|nr:hypothetical protein [Pseudomonadota bacterium]
MASADYTEHGAVVTVAEMILVCKRRVRRFSANDRLAGRQFSRCSRNALGSTDRTWRRNGA